MEKYLSLVMRDPSFLGALLGALITGSIALFIFLRDKRILKEEKEKEIELIKKQYRVFYKVKTSQIIISAENIESFLVLLVVNHQYNVEPIDEIKKSLTELKEYRTSLLNNNFNFVLPKLYELVKPISEYIDEMNSNFNGILATEEEEAEQFIDTLNSNTQKLIELIKEKTLNENLSSVFYE